MVIAPNGTSRVVVREGYGNECGQRQTSGHLGVGTMLRNWREESDPPAPLRHPFILSSGPLVSFSSSGFSSPPFPCPSPHCLGVGPSCLQHLIPAPSGKQGAVCDRQTTPSLAFYPWTLLTGWVTLQRFSFMKWGFGPHPWG